MSDITEGLGSAIEGAAASRGVEPDAGENIAAGAGPCLNCGTMLTGAHCANCGQKAHIHRSLTAIGHDLMHGVLHLDGKLWRTLPLLAWKPGVLTRRYIDGERAKFVSPMAMFLFSVFLMFAVFQTLGITTPTTLEDSNTIQIDSEAGGDSGTMQAQLTEAKEQLAALPEGSADRALAAENLAEIEQALGQSSDAQGQSDTDYSEGGSIEFSGIGLDWIDQGLVEKWSKNPGLMLYKLQTNSYKFSWLLIPISIPFVWSLFFLKRRFKAYDHAIFVTYSLGFMSLLFVTLSVLSAAGVHAAVIALSAVFIPVLHIYKQLKGTYTLSRLGAFWRTIALTNLIVFAVLMIFLWLLLLLGAF